MNRGQKIALGITVGIIVVGGIGVLAYRKFGKPRISVDYIDDVNKKVLFTMDGKSRVLGFDMGMQTGKRGYSLRISKNEKGSVNGLTLSKDGIPVETITMSA